MSTVILDDARSAQAMSALHRATEVRVYRAAIKRRLKAGDVRLAAVFADPECATMQIREVLVSLPSFGRTKARTVLQRAGRAAGQPITESRTVDSLTDRQIVALHHALRAHPVVAASCLVA